jgi:hypothetical protein
VRLLAGPFHRRRLPSPRAGTQSCAATIRIPPITPAIVEEVKATKRADPEVGYDTVAEAVRKAHNWQPVIGPTKVREILIEAKLATPAFRSPSKKPCRS